MQNRRTSKLTRNFVDARGFWLPNDYTKHGLANEYNACRNDAVLIDLSSLRKFEIIGPDAEELMNYTLTRNIKKLSVGQVVYSAMCYENGMMFDDGTLLRLSEKLFLVIEAWPPSKIGSYFQIFTNTMPHHIWSMHAFSRV